MRVIRRSHTHTHRKKNKKRANGRLITFVPGMAVTGAGHSINSQGWRGQRRAPTDKRAAAGYCNLVWGCWRKVE